MASLATGEALARSLLPVTGGMATTNGGPMASVVRGKAQTKAPHVSEATLLRIAPSSPFSCRGPYDVSAKDSNKRMAQIELHSNISSNLTMTWEVAITTAPPDGAPLTRSQHNENEASKEWEVSVRDGNGTTMYEYAYRRFNPALGSQRMNVTDSQGDIVAFIEYVTRSELRVYTCLDSASPLVGGTPGSAKVIPSASPSPAAPGAAASPAPSPAAAAAAASPAAAAASPAAAALLQLASGQEPEAEPSPDAKPRGPAYKGPCDFPRETARLSQTWGDSAAHAWTLQRFQSVEGKPPAAPADGAGAKMRFSGVGARLRAQRFLAEQYDVMMLLELAALVSHDEAPWCLAVTSAYVLIIATTVLLVVLGVASCLSRRRRVRRRKGSKADRDKTT